MKGHRSVRETIAASVMLLAVAVAFVGCAAFQSALPYLPPPDAMACAANDVERDITDPFVIVKDCPKLAEVALSDIEALVVTLLASKKATHRAAAEHGAEVCDQFRDGGAPVKTLNFANDNDAGRTDAGR